MFSVKECLIFLLVVCDAMKVKNGLYQTVA
jgi:hypothetical protein